MKFLMLGSGTSTGVPRIGEDWGACDPNEPRNRRSRVSLIVENDAGQRVLVDTSPDLRNQLLANRIDRVDAVLWTHDHADHCHGIDDLRVMRYSRSNAVPGLARAPVMASLKRRFDYIFEGQYGYPTLVEIKPVENVRMVAGFGLAAVEMPHGPTTSTGYRFEADGASLVYATDYSEITDGMLECFDGADVIISDCLRRDPHPSHATLDMAVDLAKQCRARKLVLTHLDKSMDYKTLCDEAPKHVTVGFDGFEMKI